MKSFVFDYPLNSGRENYGFLRVEATHHEDIDMVIVSHVDYHDHWGQTLSVGLMLYACAPTFYKELTEIAKQHISKLQTEAA